MHSILISKAKLAKLCTVLSLLALLAGCGGSVNGSSPSLGKTSLTPIVNAQQKTALLPNAGGSFDISGLLHVEAYGGVTCPVDHFTPFGNTLVLSKDRLTYDSGEIQQMAAYADGAINGQSPQPPDTMQIVLGSTYGEFRDWNILNKTGCTMAMSITNIGKTSFQISQMALRLTADPQQNSYRYRLIDICSLPLPHALPTCPPIAGGGGMATIFDFKLKAGSAGTIFQGQYSPDSSSQSPTLDPGQAASVVLFIRPSEPSRNLIYSVVPAVTLDISGEERTIQLTQLLSKIVFVTTSQLSCYGLQGNTFSLLTPGPHKNSWCL